MVRPVDAVDVCDLDDVEHVVRPEDEVRDPVDRQADRTLQVGGHHPPLVALPPYSVTKVFFQVKGYLILLCNVASNFGIYTLIQVACHDVYLNRLTIYQLERIIISCSFEL